ncbi:PucR family transcriptional regulator [Amycolatopsis sp. cg5]|uniref:PucR family transcriptional regulator n=1 Tax=Amycolatopsis sp. cg5 TaxID=3238802 RepID=UPI003525ADEE
MREKHRRDVTARAARDSGVAPVFLDGWVDMLTAVSGSGRRLTHRELDSRRVLGATAAEQDVPLRALIDLYLSASWMTWHTLPAITAARGKDQVVTIAEAVLRAADDAVVALADGYDGARRLVLRQEGSDRREFIDDLLYGRADLGRLAERAERFGFRLAAGYVVTAVRAATPFADDDAATVHIESALLGRFGTHDVLITTKDGLLLCIAPGTDTDVPAEFAKQVEKTLTGTWQAGVGRAHAGPSGVVRSYEEARNALDLATSLGLTARVLHASELLVYQVLFRDRAALVDLVTTVLEPLTGTRGGARPLLDTLSGYFASSGVTTETARRLFLSVRTITYRLDRIQQLTGYDPRDPAQRFTLEAAVLGARLLDWPGQDR